MSKNSQNNIKQLDNKMKETPTANLVGGGLFINKLQLSLSASLCRSA